MKNITEIERKIISAQKEVAQLHAGRSGLLERIKRSQEERGLRGNRA
jgi:copper oxidase (laccase) domain-containing protein